MSVSITNLRRRLVTLLVPEGRGVQAVRIAHGHTQSGLPDVVLDLPVVKEAQASGDFVVRMERKAMPVVKEAQASGESVLRRERAVRRNGGKR